MTRPLKDIAADLAAIAVELDSSTEIVRPDEPTVESLFGAFVEPGARAAYEFPEFEGERVAKFTVTPDIQQVGFRWAGSSEASVLHLRDISLEILDANQNAITNKLGTYAGLRGPAFRRATRGRVGVGNWAHVTGDYRDNLPMVEAGTYYLRVTCRVPRPVPLIMEVV